MGDGAQGTIQRMWSEGGSAGTICAWQQDAISALSSSPGAQTAPNSAARCLRLAFQHMALRLLGFFVLLARVQMRIRRGPLGAVERMGVPF